MRTFFSLLACVFVSILSCHSTCQPKSNTLSDSFVSNMIESAIFQTTKTVKYDGSYYKIPYPNGDVPDSVGVCTDVIIRAYRSVQVDLQKLVFEDMLMAFPEYKSRRYTSKPDKNIDHRRVPNLITFFTRHGFQLPVSKNAADYAPGDIIFWDVAAGHVGIVTNKPALTDSSTLMVVHNIGSGPVLENYLFSARIVGHFRYTPWLKK